jgi:hypothetical protein
MYKLGVTHETDILNRFKKDYAETSLDVDYILIPILSRWIPVSMTVRVEAAFERMFPKTLWTDVKYNGIGECRVFTKEEAGEIIDKLNKRFPVAKYGIQNYQKPGYEKIYFLKLIKKYKATDYFDDGD